MPDLFDRRAAALAPPPVPTSPPGGAYSARPRLSRLCAALVRAARQRSHWNEPAAFFFDPARQAQLEAACPAPVDPFAEITAMVAAEMPALLGAVEVRRVARAVPGLNDAATALAPRCPAARELAELLAVPDDEVFLVLTPHDRTGVRLHLRGAADAAQLYRLLAPALPAPFQLFTPSALQPDGSVPAGFAGCAHWLWPTQALASVPRVHGERVVCVGPTTVQPSLDVEPRFPALAVESELIQTLNAFQTVAALSRLCGHVVPVQAPVEAVARAA